MTRLFLLLLASILLIHCGSDEEEKIQDRSVTIPTSNLGRNDKVKIAVVGAGIAGASYVHFITQSLGEQAQVTVFEQSDRLGGRVKKDTLGGGMIEQGATLIHSSNHYLKHIMKTHHLDQAVPHGGEGEAETLAIWDGQDFRLNTSRNKTISGLQMLWNYGTSLSDLQKEVKKVIPKWEEVYYLLGDGYGFESPQKLFQTLGIYDLTQTTSYDYFKKAGIDDDLMYEFIDCISRVNYLQDGNINAFTDMVSLAGAGMDGGELFSVEGGNDLMIKKVLVGKQIDLRLSTKVNKIQTITSDNLRQHIITFNESEQDTFEIVVIACPLDLTDIEMPLYRTNRDREYQTVHAHFIAGEINYAYFNGVSNRPQTIFTIESRDIPFNSIAKTGYATEWGVPIYKVFSRNKLDQDFFNQTFNNIKGQTYKEWKAYTVLSPSKKWPSFQLGKGVFYINAMESAVSAMETQAVAARNVMNLTMVYLSTNRG